MHIVIIGGGFAGVCAARTLAGTHRNIDITLIDKNSSMEFRPLVPDVVSGSIRAQRLTYPLKKIVADARYTFKLGAVTGIEPQQRRVNLKNDRPRSYDYLILATGSQTPVPGFVKKGGDVFSLDTVKDAQRIVRVLDEKRHQHYLVCGAGYTGIEIATHLQKALNKRNIDKRVCVIEMQEDILTTMPQWMKEYSRSSLARQGVQLRTNTRIADVDGARVKLSDETELPNAMLIWSTGLVADLPHIATEPPGAERKRVTVHDDLHIHERIFAAGDCACREIDQHCYRMAVQAALTGGKCAAQNVLATIENKPVQRFEFFDLGYLVPTAGGDSCGIALGRKVSGKTATLLHYAMSFLRLPGMGNKFLGAWDKLSGL
ncbi:MAG: hypothetical protein GF398_19065 [Chitinivibrionales bacterium]|nr:hypothetical protein [Chitinivibrionales bacterium]